MVVLRKSIIAIHLNALSGWSGYYKTYSKDVENDTKSIYIDQKTKPLYTAYISFSQRTIITTRKCSSTETLLFCSSLNKRDLAYQVFLSYVNKIIAQLKLLGYTIFCISILTVIGVSVVPNKKEGLTWFARGSAAFFF